MFQGIFRVSSHFSFNESNVIREPGINVLLNMIVLVPSIVRRVNFVFPQQECIEIRLDLTQPNIKLEIFQYRVGLIKKNDFYTTVSSKRPPCC